MAQKSKKSAWSVKKTKRDLLFEIRGLTDGIARMLEQQLGPMLRIVERNQQLLLEMRIKLDAPAYGNELGWVKMTPESAKLSATGAEHDYGRPKAAE